MQSAARETQSNLGIKMHRLITTHNIMPYVRHERIESTQNLLLQEQELLSQHTPFSNNLNENLYEISIGGNLQMQADQVAEFENGVFSNIPEREGLEPPDIRSEAIKRSDSPPSKLPFQLNSIKINQLCLRIMFENPASDEQIQSLVNSCFQ